MFKSSVVSYQNRGRWGDPKYRGNCSGHLVRDFLQSYHPSPSALFVDPSQGGCTSMHVSNELGIRYKGLDLSTGFNLVTDDLFHALNERPQTVFWHPPYWKCVTYSGESGMWGDTVHPFDLSASRTLEEFLGYAQIAISNIYDALASGGVYGLLIGNWRSNGRYYNLSSMLERFCPGTLRDEIIKVQHNCTSDRKEYSGNLVRINHEKLFVFQKEREIFGFALAFCFQRKIDNARRITWKSAIARILSSNNGPMTLKDIYKKAEPFFKTKNNNHPEAKIRQTLQDDRLFVRIEPGVFDILRSAY